MKPRAMCTKVLTSAVLTLTACSLAGRHTKHDARAVARFRMESLAVGAVLLLLHTRLIPLHLNLLDLAADRVHHLGDPPCAVPEKLCTNFAATARISYPCTLSALVNDGLYQIM